MKLRGFSYSKLTQLQVQGARDRSSRQIEISQFVSRKQYLTWNWERQLLGTEVRDPQLFMDAIIDSFAEDDTTTEQQQQQRLRQRRREISPFMVARLSELIRWQYTGYQAEQGLEQLRYDHRNLINWMHDQISNAKIEKEQMIHDLECEIATKKQEMDQLRVKIKYELERERLEQEKEILLERIKQLQQKREEETTKSSENAKHSLQELGQDQVETASPSDNDNNKKKSCEKNNAGWINIDEDYFPANRSCESEWVVCS